MLEKCVIISFCDRGCNLVNQPKSMAEFSTMSCSMIFRNKASSSSKSMLLPILSCILRSNIMRNVYFIYVGSEDILEGVSVR